jgi:hypothetical protein
VACRGDVTLVTSACDQNGNRILPMSGAERQQRHRHHDLARHPALLARRIDEPAGGTPAHSALTFPSWMTRPKSSYWMRIKTVKSAPHVTAGYIPWATSFALTSGACTAAVNQPASREVVSFGVFAGATSPTVARSRAGSHCSQTQRWLVRPAEARSASLWSR